MDAVSVPLFIRVHAQRTFVLFCILVLFYIVSDLIYRMTETARMRHSINQDTLAKETKAREDEKKKTERRKRRELQLRQEVARRSIGNDLRRSLDKQNKEKLRSFR